MTASKYQRIQANYTLISKKRLVEKVSVPKLDLQRIGCLSLRNIFGLVTKLRIERKMARFGLFAVVVVVLAVSLQQGVPIFNCQ